MPAPQNTLSADASDRRSGAKSEASTVLTANDLLSGRIVWWTGSEWSAHYVDAVRAPGATTREALEMRGRSEEAADHVVGATVIALDADGHPKGLREARRLAGPSIALPGMEAR